MVLYKINRFRKNKFNNGTKNVNNAKTNTPINSAT